MNFFYRAYCRVFQTAFKIALPLLPYRDPKIIERMADIPAVLQREGKKKPLIVTDRNLLSLGLLNPLKNALREKDIPYAVYADVVENPTTKIAEQALAVFDEEGCDCLIAFGGGSPMDCAKAVGALAVRRKKSLNDLKGILKVRKKIPLLIAIPTTAGTGSETTLACVIVDSKTRHKYAVNDFPLIPSYAVLDEEVTMSLPARVVATTGMDALTHAIEAYIGRSGNRSTRKDALDAMKLIFENLEISCEKGTREARKNMLIASHKAGRAFSKAYVGYVHAIAHSLGGKYDTPHGLANAVILPYVLKAYGKKAEKRLSEIARFCGIASLKESEAEGARRVVETIERMNEKFSIPERLPFIREEDLDELIGYAYRETNPLYPVPELWDKEQLKNIYRQVKGE